MSTLFLACQRGDYNAVFNLTGGVKRITRTNFIAACKSGNVELVKYLVRRERQQKGQFVSFGVGLSCMTTWIRDERSIEKRIVDLVIDTLFENINYYNASMSSDVYFNYALFDAVQYGDLQRVKHLLSNLLDLPNSKSMKHYQNALLFACEFERYDIAFYLLQEQRNRSYDLKRAMSVAIRYLCVNMVFLLIHYGFNDWHFVLEELYEREKNPAIAETEREFAILRFLIIKIIKSKQEIRSYSYMFEKYFPNMMNDNIIYQNYYCQRKPLIDRLKKSRLSSVRLLCNLTNMFVCCDVERFIVRFIGIK